MSTATRLTHEQQHEYLNKALPVLEGNVAWLVEYFTPDDDGSDRFTRIEDRLERLENRFTGLENRFEGLENRFTQMESVFAQGLESMLKQIEGMNVTVRIKLPSDDEEDEHA